MHCMNVRHTNLCKIVPAVFLFHNFFISITSSQSCEYPVRLHIFHVYIYIYMNMCGCLFVHLFAHQCTGVNPSLHLRIYICTNIHLSIHIFIYLYVKCHVYMDIYVHMFIYKMACIYTCICIII